MKEYKYEKTLFPKTSSLIIDEMIKKGFDEEILNIATQINKKNQPVFNVNEIDQIRYGAENGLSVDDIKCFAINNNGHSTYDCWQMNYIREGIRNGLSKEDVEIYAKLNKENKPIYDSNQMNTLYLSLFKYISKHNKISKRNVNLLAKLNSNMKPVYNHVIMRQLYYAMVDHLPKIAIEICSRLNSNEKPVYDEEQIKEIRIGFQEKYSLDEIEMFVKLQNEVPMFNSVEMHHIKSFIHYHRDTDKMEQLKDCIERNLKFEQFSFFFDTSILSTEQIRVAKTFYDLNCTDYEVKRFMKIAKNYEELKEIKYLLQCAKCFDVNPKVLVFIGGPIDPGSVENVNDMLAASVCSDRMKGEAACDVVKRCLSYKMEPKQLDYITNIDDDFNSEEMKFVAVALLNGLTVEEIKDVVNKNRNKADKMLQEALDDAVRMKFGDISDIDINIRHNVDLFNDIER